MLSRGSVGPYDYVVIRSEDGATLRTWLANNGYYVSEDAARIVDEYVAGGHSFVAVKLQVGQDTSAIRPIILRLQSPEACLPLKLTAIAATPDLRINVWVLADARAIPINYVEIAVNQAKLDWFNFGRNYDQLLKEAANEAQGNAFAVEYAQPSAAAATWFTLSSSSGARGAGEPSRIRPSYLSALRRSGLTPTGAVMQVRAEVHPAAGVAGGAGGDRGDVLRRDISSYWSNNRDAFAPFDPVAMTAELEAEVLRPIDMFRALFGRNAYLTRLATFISPEEMTKDPLFVTNRLLPDVAPQRTAVAHVLCGDEEFDSCSAPVRLELEDGRNGAVPGRRLRRRRRVDARRHRRDAVGGCRLEPRSRQRRPGRRSTTARRSRRRWRRTTRRSRRPARAAAARCARAARHRDAGAAGASIVALVAPASTPPLALRAAGAVCDYCFSDSRTLALRARAANLERSGDRGRPSSQIRRCRTYR